MNEKFCGCDKWIIEVEPGIWAHEDDSRGAIAMDVSRMRYLCGILHRTGLAGRRQPEGTVDLRRSRGGFLTRHATPAATHDGRRRWAGPACCWPRPTGPSTDTRLPGIMPALIGGGAGEGLA
jgi:hypothetical protein